MLKNIKTDGRVNHTHYDICILGSGLSGCLLALLARQNGLNGCIIEKRAPPGAHPTPLAWETIPRSFIECLSKYQVVPSGFLEDNHHIQRNDQLISAWGTTNTSPQPGDHYYHINKLSLNTGLRSLSNLAGVPIFENQQQLTYGFVHNKWIVMTGKQERLSCNLLIDATGRNSFFASKQGVKKVFFDEHYALFHTTGISPSKENYFIIESARNGWWYANKSNHAVQTVFISNREHIKRPGLEQYYLNNMAGTYFIKQLDKTFSKPCVKVKDARAGILSQTYGRNWIAIGDSAFTLDPLSGNGNTCIAENMFQVVDLVLQFTRTADQQYLTEMDRINNKLFATHLLERKKYYALEKRWPNNVFWKNIN